MFGNKVLCVLFSGVTVCNAMNPSLSEIGEMTVSQRSFQTQKQPSMETTSPSIVYVPQAYDVTEELVGQSKCCFRTSRWLLQPLSVIAPLLTTVFLALGEYFRGSKDDVANKLDLVALVCSLASFASGTLLLKVNNKLKTIDRHVEQRRQLDVTADQKVEETIRQDNQHQMDSVITGVEG